ncbi:hypothetical protein Indivirus_3_37 [Indivirus ILV1]|uniref:Uncharacterized protein n=1 Tax=Indivirus ILV1 TaxID=1977633 RepID=A0A1V0SDQ9_9VIRU|nr:hypothetical protein Indivirus_3_37 [Indivirus ILV1]
MSLILAKRALCSDPSDYESLLPSITIIKNLLDCDSAGNTEEGVAPQLISKLFCDPDGAWANVSGNTGIQFESCFNETTVYYNKKSCNGDVPLGNVVWEPEISSSLAACVDKAFTVLGGATGTVQPTAGNYTGAENDPAAYKTFKAVADLFAAYLSTVSNAPNNYPLEDVIKVLDCLCELVEQKISINRVLRKTAFTIDHCDF